MNLSLVHQDLNAKCGIYGILCLPLVITEKSEYIVLFGYIHLRHTDARAKSFFLILFFDIWLRARVTHAPNTRVAVERITLFGL